MKPLPITSYAVAGAGSEHAPEARRVPLPPPGTKRRGGRLPLLACGLAQLAGAKETPETSVLFGTALGCLTETAMFVEHMVEADEATPKPRAFSSSVHNAIAAKVALEIGAHGECQTFAHGEVSFGHALFAAQRANERATAPIVLGALDEANEYIARGRAACGLDTAHGEGGAVLTTGTGPALASIELVGFGRDDDTAIQVGSIADGAPHGSSLATMTALAVGVVAGEVAAEAIRAPNADRILLHGRSRFGDTVLLQVAAP